MGLYPALGTAQRNLDSDIFYFSSVYTHTCVHVYIHTCVCVCVYIYIYGFPGGSAVRNPPANAGDMGWIPRSERSPGVGSLGWEDPLKKEMATSSRILV